MQKLFLINLIISVMIINHTKGQQYDKIASHHFGNGNKINKVDSIGRKQGYWFIYDYSIYYYDKINIPLIEPKMVKDTSFKRISDGEYLNDKKIGKWYYYDDEIDTRRTIKIEEYNPDGSVLVKENTEIFPNAITYYSSDSIEVISTVVNRADTICINCKEKRICVLKFENKILKEFDYKFLDFIKFGLLYEFELYKKGYK